MSEIKPIETFYKGYRFRSRLEARWAVFFDSMGIEYQYEPEGFEIDLNDGEKIFYLPDFYLPNEGCYVEVKGTDNALRADGRKIAFAIDWNSTPCSDGLLILGDIPDPTKIGWGNIPMFSFLYNNKGIVHVFATFMPTNVCCGKRLIRGSREIILRLYSYDDEDFSDAYAEEDIPRQASTKCWWSKDTLRSYGFNDPSKFVYKLTQSYAKARQARFEHGETPTI